MTSGRDRYAAKYRKDVDLEAEWLRLGASDKVESVAILLTRHGIEPDSVLELGCGTGAVIAECQRRALGREFTAIDYSSDAIEFLASRSKGIRCIARDITDPSFVMEGYYDVGIVSHVIEHLENPLAFLRAITQKMRMGHLVLEVPLEDLSIARWKAKFRDRAKNLAGHVQFFTEATFRQLVESSGLEIVDGRTYSPVLKPEVIDFVCRKDGISGPRAWLKMATGHYLPRYLGPLWRRTYYAHCTLLCKLRPLSSSGR